MRGYGQITLSVINDGKPGADGKPSINIILGNEFQNIPCNSNGIVPEAFLIEIPFYGYIGFDKTNVSVSVGVLPSGITTGSITNATPTTNGKIVLNVAKNANLGGSSVTRGTIPLTFTINNMKVEKSFSWTKTKDGATGVSGKGVKSVANYYLATSSASGVTVSTSGWTTTVQTITATKKYLWNYEMVTYTDNSTTKTTPCIIGAYGDKGEQGIQGSKGEPGATGAAGNGISNIVEYYQVSTSNTTAPTSWLTTVPTLTVANKYLWNYERITYTNGTTKDTAKRVIGVYGDKGQTGAAGSMTIYELRSSDDVLSKKYNDTISPNKITFSAVTRSSNSTTFSAYSGMFIIKESTDGSTYTTKYTSKVNESSVQYALSSNNVLKVQCILCSAGSTTNQIDLLTIPVLTDTSLKEEITTIKKEVSGVSSKVDSVEKSITNKVWKNDITTQINNYDNTTVKTIRDQVATQTTEIGQIKNSVSDVTTKLDKKADGSTVTELSKKVAENKLDADGFKQTVEKTYAKKSDVESEISSVKSEFTQEADRISGEVSDLDGKVTKLNQTVTTIEGQVADNKGNIADLKLESDIIKLQVDKKQGCIPTYFRYIRDWLNGSNYSAKNEWVECCVVANNKNIVKNLLPVLKDENGKPVTTQPSEELLKTYTDGIILNDVILDEIYALDSGGSDEAYEADLEQGYIETSGGLQCLELDIGEPRGDIEYIQIFHFYSNEQRTFNHKLEVSADGTEWFTIYDSSISKGYSEDKSGRIYNIASAYINKEIANLIITSEGLKVTVDENSKNLSSLQLQTDEFQVEIVDKVDGNFATLTERADIFSTKLESTTKDMKKLSSEFAQTSSEIKALFSDVGMGDDPNRNTNVVLSIDGMKVINPDTGQLTLVSPYEFAGYYNDEVVFKVDKDQTILSRTLVEKGIDFGSSLKLINGTYKTKSNKIINALLHVNASGNS